jgi:Plasmid pRiA4b ORF-3-like protein
MPLSTCTPAPPMPNIARLKITLDNVAPAVERRVEVPADIRLDDLHLVIQVAMPWDNYHLYEFRAGAIAWGIPDPDVRGFSPSEPRPASKATLADLLAEAGGERFAYAYDFGDGWEHSVEVEAIVAAVPDITYPRLIGAHGRCPPEDVGGPWGYADYLDAIADPKHERYEELIEWRGPGFDPAIVDEAAIHKGLASLAKRLLRRKGKGTKSARRRSN